MRRTIRKFRKVRWIGEHGWRGLTEIVNFHSLSHPNRRVNFILSHNIEVNMRTTSDLKDKNIKVRLGDDLKTYVDKISSRKGMSISEYIRDLIRQDMRTNQL